MSAPRWDEKAERLVEALKDALVCADSDLSWARHWNSWPIEEQRRMDETLGKLRSVQKALAAADLLEGERESGVSRPSHHLFTPPSGRHCAICGYDIEAHTLSPTDSQSTGSEAKTMAEVTQGPAKPNLMGHDFSFDRSATGYGICECGARENTPMAANPCGAPAPPEGEAEDRPRPGYAITTERTEIRRAMIAAFDGLGSDMSLDQSVTAAAKALMATGRARLSQSREPDGWVVQHMGVVHSHFFTDQRDAHTHAAGGGFVFPVYIGAPPEKEGT